MARTCTKINEWIEDKVSKPIEEWEKQRKEKCKKRKWYDPRSWLCWFVVALVKITRWILVKTGKWVIRFVCRVITSVIDGLIDIFRGLITFFRGLVSGNWRMMLDGLGLIVSGFLGIAGIGILILVFIGTGLLGLMLLGAIVAFDIADYIIDEVNANTLREYVRELVKNKYGQGDLYNSISDALGLEHGVFGFRLKALFLRGFLDARTKTASGEYNLIALRNQGLDLIKLCGFKNTNKWYTAGPRYETVKTDIITGEGNIDLGFGNLNGISENELNEYINTKGQRNNNFRIYCFSNPVLKIKLDTASEKGRELGLMLKWDTSEIELKEKEFIDPYSIYRQQRFLIDVIKRKECVINPRETCDTRKPCPDALSELCLPTAVGMFNIDGHSGYATNLMNTECSLKCHTTSGVTIVDVQPDIFRKYVLIHELGHYFGLCHVEGFDRMMVSGDKKEPPFWSWDAIPNFLLHSGPRFTIDEAKQVWRYIINYFIPECLAKRHY